MASLFQLVYSQSLNLTCQDIAGGVELSAHGRLNKMFGL